MPELTLPAGTYWDRTGHRADRDLELTPDGPLLEATDPRRVAITGYAADGRFVTVEIDRDALPPERSGPERQDYEPGIDYQRGDAVWVWSTWCRAWCAGTVDAVSKFALQVTYELTAQRGTARDTVPPGYVARRSPIELVGPETSPSG